MFPTRDVPYYVGALVVRQRRGALRVLVMRTVRTAPPEGLALWQLPGGMEEIPDNGNPIKTLDRELFQETGLSLRRNHDVDPPTILKEGTPEGHVRYFYLLWRNDVRGVLRSEPVADRKKILGVPVWESPEFLDQYLCDSHRPVWEAFKAQYPHLFRNISSNVA